MINEIYNAEDETQIAARQKKADKKKFTRDETIRNLMSKKDGRAWIYHLLEEADMWGSPIDRGDPYETYSNIEGCQISLS